MRKRRVSGPISQQRETTDGKVWWARSSMQVGERSGEVMGKYLGGQWSSTVLEGRLR